jgi:hypothetical protein
MGRCAPDAVDVRLVTMLVAACFLLTSCGFVPESVVPSPIQGPVATPPPPVLTPKDTPGKVIDPATQVLATVDPNKTVV